MSNTTFIHGFKEVLISSDRHDDGTNCLTVRFVSEGAERDMDIHVFREHDAADADIPVTIEDTNTPCSLPEDPWISPLDMEPGRLYRVPDWGCLQDRGTVYVTNVIHEDGIDVTTVEGFWFHFDVAITNERGLEGSTFASPVLDNDRRVKRI